MRPIVATHSTHLIRHSEPLDEMPAGADPERFQFLQTNCQRMPTESECRPLYDFLMGNSPSPNKFHKIWEWLWKSTLPRNPFDWPAKEETRMKVMKIMAGIQGFCPTFVPTFQLNHYHRATQGEIDKVAAASKCGLACNVEEDVYGLVVNKHGGTDTERLANILASPTCTIRQLTLVPKGWKPGLKGLVEPIEKCPSLRVLSCPLNQELFDRIGKYSSIEELHLICKHPTVLNGSMKEALVHALEMGRIETVSISGSHENPNAYEFADLVDRANLRGGKLKRVCVKPDKVQADADGATVRKGRELALKKLLSSTTIEDVELPSPLWLIDLPARKAQEWIDQGRLKSLKFNLDNYDDNHWRAANLTQSEINKAYALAEELEQYVATRAQAEKDQALQAGMV